MTGAERPNPLLGREATNRSAANRAMTVAWYLAGGLAAAAQGPGRETAILGDVDSHPADK